MAQGDIKVLQEDAGSYKEIFIMVSNVSVIQIPPPLTLDNITGSVGAFSVRKLLTAYTGACMKIRRSSDNTQIDIGFIDNYLDTATMLGFVGAGDGFVTIWYDQSGNNHNITSPSDATQPIIVSSGALVVNDHGDPVVSTDGVDDVFSATITELATAPALSVFQAYSTNVAAGENTPSAYQWSIGNTNTDTRVLVKGSSTGVFSGEYTYFDVRRTSGGPERLGSTTYRRPANTSHVESDFILNTGIKAYQNGIEITYDLTNGGALVTTDYTPALGNVSSQIDFSATRVSGSFLYFKAQKYSEIILFADDKSAYRQALENDISTFFFNVGLTVNLVASNPYLGIDFDTINTYKAEFHSHTIYSDGLNTPTELVDAYSARGYDILAITDHDTIPTDGALPTYPLSEYTAYEPTVETAGTPAEFYPDISMMLVLGNELTGIPADTTHHRVSLFNGIWTPEQVSSGDFATRQNDIQWTLDKIAENGGLSILAHPSWHTNFGTTYDLNFYLGQFANTANLLGMEVKTGLTRNDEPIWDSVLNSAVSKNVWGFSDGDDHDISIRCGTNYNMIFSASLIRTNIFNALKNGQFYFVIDSDGVNVARHNPNVTPIITRIVADDYSIEITALNTSIIQWINNGTVIFTGNKFIAGNFSGINYIRAKLTGSNGGYAFTQAFKIT